MDVTWVLHFAIWCSHLWSLLQIILYLFRIGYLEKVDRKKIKEKSPWSYKKRKGAQPQFRRLCDMRLDMWYVMWHVMWHNVWCSMRHVMWCVVWCVMQCVAYDIVCCVLCDTGGFFRASVMWSVSSWLLCRLGLAFSHLFIIQLLIPFFIPSFTCFFIYLSTFSSFIYSLTLWYLFTPSLPGSHASIVGHP